MTDHQLQITGGDRIHTLGLATMMVSNSPVEKIQMTGAVIGMMQGGLNLIKRKNLRGELFNCDNNVLEPCFLFQFEKQGFQEKCS